MDPPECPVCLEQYTPTTVIPRVLSCGHTTCQSCLTSLSNIHSTLSPTLLRCPICNHLLNLPSTISSLPKNISLLNLTPHDHQPTKAKTKVKVHPKVIFPHGFFSKEVFEQWKDFVLGKDCVFVEKDWNFKGRIVNCDVGFCGFLKWWVVEGMVVSLVRVGCFEGRGDGGGGVMIEYSYVSKMMSVLGENLSEGERSDLWFVLGVSLRGCGKVCRVLGVWLDEESGWVYLVSERKGDNDGFLGFGGRKENEGSVRVERMVEVGVELCEVLIKLRSEGLVCGCLGVSCFCLDEFGHVCFDLSEVLVVGRRVREVVVRAVKGRRKLDGSDVEELVESLLNVDVFLSPEVLVELLRLEGVEVENNGIDTIVDCRSDVWLFGCVLIRLLTDEQFPEGMYAYLRTVCEPDSEGVSEVNNMYMQWIEKISATMEGLLGSGYQSVKEILLKCLDVDPRSRPLVTDVWECIRRANNSHHLARPVATYSEGNSSRCLVLGELCNVSNDLRKELVADQKEDHHECERDSREADKSSVNGIVKGISGGKVRCKDLQGHLDCITGFCVGGGFLFSSSFDKTVNVWSLEDFTHLHTFKGHEHRVMALVFVDQDKPLCISADNGGGIFCWEVTLPFGKEPVKKWYEEKDWRYSGIHSLAVSETSCVYTGSGDRLIKAWSLSDCTLLCNMEGHKSVVSTLALCNGVLYSGSWDGTVRLWSLHNHSPLAVFAEPLPGSVSSVLSVHADQNMVIAVHENGVMKIWMNEVLRASKQFHKGAICALGKEEKWVFTGGWDKTVKIQEISGDGHDLDIREVGSVACDSVVTALLCVEGILFVGYASRLIKVYFGHLN